jgi:hypothetical protein
MLNLHAYHSKQHAFHSRRVKALFCSLALIVIFIATASSSAVQAATYSAGTTADLQYYLSIVQPGDTIVLTAGATFIGPFTLPYRAGSNTDADWITIRTSAPDSRLPPAGQRISPSYASILPKIYSPGSGQSALYTAAGAHHYKFIGVEFAPQTVNAAVDTLISLGNRGTAQDTLTITLKASSAASISTART